MVSTKGMYFSLLTILFLVIFLFFFSVHIYRKNTDKMFAIESRITSMDSFLNDVNRDLERGLYISSFRAILSMQEYMTLYGVFFHDIQSDFFEAITNGTINGTHVSMMDSALESAKITDWIDNINEQAEQLNLVLNISIKNFSLYQNDPWHITVGINATLQLSDSAGLATWNKQLYIETVLGIEGFEDPLYIVHGLGRFSNAINITRFDNNYSYYNGSVWNISNLITHFEGSLYAAHSDAPSFLMRFENNLSTSPQGIESIINLQELASRFSPEEMTIYYDKCIIDYIYWSEENPPIYRINNTPSWYKIDNDHRAKYNVTSISYSYG
jgi:hypothetical protein